MLEQERARTIRRSLRLPGYDYSQCGAYFMTICTENRKCLFGRVLDGLMVLSDVGRVIEAEWLRTPTIRPQVQLDAYVVMPNHIHGILLIDGDSEGNSRSGSTSGRMQDAPTADGPTGFQAPSRTAGAVVRGFKGATSSQVTRMLRSRDIMVWQRNYYEHIIRDEGDLNRIREYIEGNPARWADDAENPEKA